MVECDACEVLFKRNMGKSEYMDEEESLKLMDKTS